jgi:hypothetical protein
MAKRFCYSSILSLADVYYKKENIFILPIEEYENYSNKLSNFIGVDLSNIKYPHDNSFRSNGKQIRHLLVIEYIKEYIEKSTYIMDIVKNDLLLVDKKCGSNLYQRYIHE